MPAQGQCFPNDLQRRLQALIKEQIEAELVRPKQGMEILEQYMAFFGRETYLDNPRGG